MLATSFAHVSVRKFHDRRLAGAGLAANSEKTVML